MGAGVGASVGAGADAGADADAGAGADVGAGEASAASLLPHRGQKAKSAGASKPQPLQIRMVRGMIAIEAGACGAAARRR